MKLLKSSIWSFLAVLFRGISALSINKLFAVYFGPAEFGLLSHFQNLTTIFSTIPSDGINRGIIRYLSPNSVTVNEKRYFFSAGLILNVFVFLLTLLVTFIFPDYFFSKFKTSTPYWIVIFIFSMLFLIFDFLLISLIIAFKKTFHFFLIEFFGSIVFFIYLYIALSYYSISIQVALIHYMLALSMGFIVVFILILSQNNYREVIVLKFPKPFHFKKINSFLIMALTAVLFQKGIDFYIREFSFTTFGNEATGVWQGVVKISDYYLMAFTSVIMMSFYPQITSSLHNSKILKKVLFDGFKLYIPLILIGCIFVFFSKTYLIEFLLDKQFLKGTEYIHWQILGDALKMISMIMGLLMLAQVKIKWFITGEFISAFSYIFCIHFMQDEGVTGVLKAHFYRYIIYFVYLTVYYRKLIF